ncbi:M20 family metallopeptidase [Aliicoccus persicus]|uniref:Glutamate carboxypeptidase n=1 Tax=Aliicoccus persicus TaxID=930138 RepID=A0A662Z7F0_9STAP|nr:M20 family metallopeptidase [Aliicoccus persicus]SEW19696.1 glutamate carboxypeptidase [Aliicoccus persicus]
MLEGKEYFENNLNNIIDDLITIVRLDSPSKNKVLVDKCLNKLDELFEDYLGISPKIFESDTTGNHRLYEKNSSNGEGVSILLLGHVDTVWDEKQIPIKRTEKELSGPGVLDMKGGLIQALWVLKYLSESDGLKDTRISFFINSDEEIGSNTSKEIIQEISDEYDYVLVLEPPVVDSGDLKTGRKGTAAYNIRFVGKKSHSGNDHESGENAIVEAAKQVSDLSLLTDYDKGITINVGSISGGGKINIVPDEAEIGIDVRAERLEDLEYVDEAIQNIEAYNKAVEIIIEGEINRPPMNSTKNDELFLVAKDIADELELDLDSKFVGGGSDGNFTSDVGIPTLDGLGVFGEGIHQEHEKIFIYEVPERASLLAGLILSLTEKEKKVI